jgi:transcriptional regulator with XRE-family HTH domain
MATRVDKPREAKPPETPGGRLAEARRAAGLTQKALAQRLGVSLWTVEELEHGRRDLASHVLAIAAATGRSPSWFEGEAIPAEPPSAQTPRRRMPGHARLLARRKQAGTSLVLVSLALLVLIRVATEIVHVLPRAANFIDIPIFFVLAISATLRWRQRERATGPSYLALGLPAFGFVCICMLGVAFNLSRVEPGPVLVFIYGFLAPIGVYASVYRLWPAGQGRSLSQLLVRLAVVELLVVFLYDFPRFVSSGNPDLISGTFGTNAYQLVFFLLVITGLLAGIYTNEKGRLASRVAPALFILILVTMFLAQYRALLATTAVTILLIAALLGRRVRGIVAAALVGVTLVITLSYVGSHFPGLRFSSTVSSLTSKPGYYFSKRLSAASSVVKLYSDDPRYMITGTGPGTFSSRAWYTFAFANVTSRSNVQGKYALTLTGGHPYQTDVANKYVLPRYHNRAAILGSQAVTSPFTEYVSLLAEVGLPGFILTMWIYLRATARAVSLTRQSMRRRVAGDPLPALMIACAVAFTVLLQMAFLDNWLEVTRITFLAWALLAVCSKEADSAFSQPSA